MECVGFNCLAFSGLDWSLLRPCHVSELRGALTMHGMVLLMEVKMVQEHGTLSGKENNPRT